MMAPKNRYKLEDFEKDSLKNSVEKQNFSIKEKLEFLIYGYIKNSGSKKKEVTTTLSEAETITFAQPDTTPEAVPEAVVFQPKQTELREFVDDLPTEELNGEPTYATTEDVKTIFERVLTKTKKTTSDGR